MRTERWTSATVLALCIVVALMGAGLAKTRLDGGGAPNPWVAPN